VEQQPTALRWKLWPHLGNGLQQSSDNLNVESTTDCLPFRHKFFMNHTLFFKKCDHQGFDLGPLQTKLFGPW
jgi:elongation factor P hydroxylase